MLSVTVVCHLWDIEDEGIDAVLDRIQGEVGADGLTVIAAGRPRCQPRRRPDGRPRIIQSDGGLFFPPDETKYVDTRCKPAVSRWPKSRDALRKVSEACLRRGMRFRASLDTRRIGRIVSRCPAVAAKTAFGDVSPGTMCTSNPDAVAFLRGLVGDLSSNYEPDAIELRALDQPFETDLAESVEMPCPADGATAGRRGGAGETVRTLLGICFCESCLQWAGQAGIDAESARRCVQVTLNGAFTSSRVLPESIDGLLADDAILAAYVAHRRAVHTDVVATLAGCARCDVVLEMRDRAFADGEQGAVMVSGCAAVSVVVSPPLSEAGDPALARALEVCRGRESLRCEARLPAGAPLSNDESMLIRTVKRLVDLGVRAVHLDHYGVMYERGLASAARAIRYARRSAGV